MRVADNAQQLSQYQEHCPILQTPRIAVGVTPPVGQDSLTHLLSTSLFAAPADVDVEYNSPRMNFH
jgi:hypothetical protein